MSCLTRQYSDVIFTLPSWDSLDELSSHHYRNELLNGRVPGSNPMKGKRLNLRSYPLTIHLAELVPTITLDFTMLYIDGFYNCQYMKIIRSDGASTNELWILYYKNWTFFVVFCHHTISTLNNVRTINTK